MIFSEGEAFSAFVLFELRYCECFLGAGFSLNRMGKDL